MENLYHIYSVMFLYEKYYVLLRIYETTLHIHKNYEGSASQNSIPLTSAFGYANGHNGLFDIITRTTEITNL